MIRTTITDPADKELLMSKFRGIVAIAGAFGSGKTIFCLSNPFSTEECPTIVVDVDYSSEQYKGIFPFIPINITNETTLSELVYKVQQVKKRSVIVLESIDMLQEYITEDTFSSVSEAMALKSQSLVWAKVKNGIRKVILELKKHCDLLILTTHTRLEWEGSLPTNMREPKMMVPGWELSHLVLTISKKPSEVLPSAVLDPARGKSRFVTEVNNRLVPTLPPRISPFTWETFLKYIKQPADYSNLKFEEKTQETASYVSAVKKALADAAVVASKQTDYEE